MSLKSPSENGAKRPTFVIPTEDGKAVRAERISNNQKKVDEIHSTPLTLFVPLGMTDIVILSKERSDASEESTLCLKSPSKNGAERPKIIHYDKESESVEAFTPAHQKKI